MHAKYYVITFAMCLFIWAILIDNLVIPGNNSLKQDVGAYTHYRLKKWSKNDKLDRFLHDELMVYAVVNNREQLYYMEYKPNFEYTLKNLPEGTPIQLRYVNAFPKFWKRSLYDMRINGQSVMSYSQYYLTEKQKENWKITGIMAGIYLFLVVVGLLNKPRRR